MGREGTTSPDELSFQVRRYPHHSKSILSPQGSDLLAACKWGEVVFTARSSQSGCASRHLAKWSAAEHRSRSHCRTGSARCQAIWEGWEERQAMGCGADVIKSMKRKHRGKSKI